MCTQTRFDESGLSVNSPNLQNIQLVRKEIARQMNSGNRVIITGKKLLIFGKSARGFAQSTGHFVRPARTGAQIELNDSDDPNRSKRFRKIGSKSSQLENRFLLVVNRARVPVSTSA